MDRETAETLALRALAYIAADERLLEGMIDRSGVDLQQLRETAEDPAVLGGILDYLLADEPVLLEFCRQEQLEPDLPSRARAALPGAFNDR